jgi:hypothetical protein
VELGDIVHKYFSFDGLSVLAIHFSSAITCRAANRSDVDFRNDICNNVCIGLTFLNVDLLSNADEWLLKGHSAQSRAARNGCSTKTLGILSAPREAQMGTPPGPAGILVLRLEHLDNTKSSPPPSHLKLCVLRAGLEYKLEPADHGFVGLQTLKKIIGAHLRTTWRFTGTSARSTRNYLLPTGYPPGPTGIPGAPRAEYLRIIRRHRPATVRPLLSLSISNSYRQPHIEFCGSP